MGAKNILEGKKQIVSEIADKMKNAKSFVVVDYKGINVLDATNLRSKTREAGVDYKIYKNTFLRFAAKEAGFDALSDIFVGSSAIAFSNEDIVAPAKVIAEFVNDGKLKILEFKGGVIDGEITDINSIKQISKLPSKETLLSQMLGSLNAPIANFARVIDQIAKKGAETA